MKMKYAKNAFIVILRSFPLAFMVVMVIVVIRLTPFPDLGKLPKHFENNFFFFWKIIIFSMDFRDEREDEWKEKSIKRSQIWYLYIYSFARFPKFLKFWL